MIDRDRFQSSLTRADRLVSFNQELFLLLHGKSKVTTPEAIDEILTSWGLDDTIAPVTQAICEFRSKYAIVSVNKDWLLFEPLARSKLYLSSQLIIGLRSSINEMATRHSTNNLRLVYTDLSVHFRHEPLAPLLRFFTLLELSFFVEWKSCTSSTNDSAPVPKSKPTKDIPRDIASAVNDPSRDAIGPNPASAPPRDALTQDIIQLIDDFIVELPQKSPIKCHLQFARCRLAGKFHNALLDEKFQLPAAFQNLCCNLIILHRTQ